MTQTLASARIVEETSLNAWPSLQQILYDGWVLRFANGYTRRANSVNPIYAGALDTATKIKRCEQIYRDRQLKTIFKITPFVQPANLDELLNQAGYKKDALTSVQTLDLASLPSTTPMQYWDQPAEEWVEQYVRMNRVAAANRSTLQAILDNIAPQTCFMILAEQARTVSCGLGVFDGQYVGLFDIVTNPVHRGKGFGTNLMLSILNWARRCGAQKAYLQVMLDNDPALKLYTKLGFKEIYKYWYRVKE